MATKQVGIFIDFENLIYGLIDRYGEQGAYEHFQMQRILDYAERHGRVRWAWAYADWRIKAVNRFQSELYTRGVELVHVLGRGHKNAVDMKMAVDMIEAHYTQEGVGTFILCSGDRDFLPVLNTLRRNGKQMIGLAPQRAMSPECKRLCSEVVSYESLLGSALSEPQSPPPGNLNRLKTEVTGVIRSYHPQPVPGALLKQLLMQAHHGQFKEQQYGFIKFGDLLESFRDVLSVERPDQGDFTVSLQQALLDDEGEVVIQDDHALQAALSALKGYQYMIDAPHRRRALREVFTLLYRSEGVKWADILPQFCDRADLSKSQANKYHAILLQSQAFHQIDPNDQLPVKQRLMRLIEELDQAERLIERYEQSILLKVCAKFPDTSPELARRILGLSETPENLTYTDQVLKQAHAEAFKP